MSFKLGQIIYYQVRRGFIVTAKITEIVKFWDITPLNLKGIESTQSFETLNEKGETIVTLGYYDWKTESMINLSDRYEEIKQKCLEPSEDCWDYWIDEPTGHGLRPDYDHIYLTLKEAFSNTIQIDRRQAKRKNQKIFSARKRKIKSINNTRKNDPVDFKLGDKSKQYKKIYCNIGRRTIIKS